MESTRVEKIARLLQRDLGEIFQREAQGALRGKLITVSEVRITPNLEKAKVFLSVFPTQYGDEVVKEVQANVSFFRNLLGKRVRHQLRIVPELQFVLDISMDKLERIDELLNK